MGHGAGCPRAHTISPVLIRPAIHRQAIRRPGEIIMSQAASQSSPAFNLSLAVTAGGRRLGCWEAAHPRSAMVIAASIGAGAFALLCAFGVANRDWPSLPGWYVAVCA